MYWLEGLFMAPFFAAAAAAACGRSVVCHSIGYFKAGLNWIDDPE